MQFQHHYIAILCYHYLSLSSGIVGHMLPFKIHCSALWRDHMYTKVVWGWWQSACMGGRGDMHIAMCWVGLFVCACDKQDGWQWFISFISMSSVTWIQNHNFPSSWFECDFCRKPVSRQCTSVSSCYWLVLNKSSTCCLHVCILVVQQ